MKTIHTPEEPLNEPSTSFLVLPDMGFSLRLCVGGGLILAGFILQYLTLEEWIGAALLLIGNLLFLVRGVGIVRKKDASVGFVRRKWEKAELSRLHEIIEHDKKVSQWNLSAWDFSNPLGAFVFLLITALCVVGYIVGHHEESVLMRILCMDAAVLLLPHWVTGRREGHRIPDLMMRAEILSEVLDRVKPMLDELEVDALFELPEKGEPLPTNVKLRVRAPGLPESFLGLEVHVSLNNVQGTNYPYLYCVLIARKGFGLEDLREKVCGPFLRDYSIKDDVEVLVLRQPTSKTSGYHTNAQKASAILKQGIEAMRSLPSSASSES